MRRSLLVWSCTALILLLAACGRNADFEVPLTLQPSATLSPAETVSTPTPEPPPSTLVVCLWNEPQSLYLYGDTNRETDLALEAIYDGPFDLLGHQVEPVILERVPSLAGGDARLESVMVKEGDLFLNPETLQPQYLGSGLRYLPSGCQNQDCVITYYSGEVAMDRLVVDFHLRPGIQWSDGQPVKASDSKFSFSLDAHRDTPTVKFLVDRTASYEALDDLTARWTGIPGFLDNEYAANFWTPLPEHVLGSLAPRDLLDAEQASRSPIGWGPYVVDNWQAGQQILLRRNPAYFRASEGLPAFDFLAFRFLGEAGSDEILQQVVSSECDILDESLADPSMLPQIMDLAQKGNLQLASAPGTLVERLEFNLSQTDWQRPQFFRDIRTRQAIAACINRAAIANELFSGLAVVPETYVPPAHPLAFQPATPIQYEPQTAATLLQAAGWVDHDGQPQTARVAAGARDVQAGTRLAVRLLTTPGFVHETVAQRIQEDLAACGIELEVVLEDAETLFAPWPDGPAFGRTYDMVLWAWPVLLTPPCEMFAGNQIASEDNVWGINASGFYDQTYNGACRQVQLGLADSQEFQGAVRSTQEILAAQLPSVPLFVVPRLVVHRTELCAVKVDGSALTVLWNVEEYSLAETCAD